MFFRISGHADTEIRRRAVLHLARKILAAVHGGYLRNEFAGMAVPAFVRAESMFAPHVVPAQGQHVVYAQKIHLDKCVFRFIGRKTAADKMRNHIYRITRLYSCRYAHRTGTLTHHAAFQKPAFALHQLYFLTVVGNVYIRRGKLPESVYR